MQTTRGLLRITGTCGFPLTDITSVSSITPIDIDRHTQPKSSPARGLHGPPKPPALTQLKPRKPFYPWVGLGWVSRPTDLFFIGWVQLKSNKNVRRGSTCMFISSMCQFLCMLKIINQKVRFRKTKCII